MNLDWLLEPIADNKVAQQAKKTVDYFLYGQGRKEGKISGVGINMLQVVERALQMRQPIPIPSPAPSQPTAGENPYIYGLHDAGGQHLLEHSGQKRGWILITEEIGHDPNNQGGRNYEGYEGFGLIVRLNNAYGESGTLPHSSQYENFAKRTANFVRNSKGCHIWIIGNETNFNREAPRHIGSNDPELITPDRYVRCYTMCRAAIRSLPGHQNDKVLVSPIAPWNNTTPSEGNPSGDWNVYLQHILIKLAKIGQCDGIAIHAYSHGYDPALVYSDQKMSHSNPIFAKYHWHFKCYLDQLSVIPQSLRHLPVYLTEMNGDVENHVAWPNHRRGWIEAAYNEIDYHNKNRHDLPKIRCGILYRWIDHDHWSIKHKTHLHEEIKRAVSQGFKWTS